jgi:hypothetical protein
MNNSDTKWYYCLTHNKAEQGVGCKGGDRMGPYPDENTATRALELARERTKAEDKKDNSWGAD